MTEKSDNRVPYVSYKTFESLIGELAAMETGVPDHIDRSVLRKKSGVDQTGLLRALEFLSLIDPETGETRKELKALVVAKASGEESTWKVALRDMLERGFASVTGGLTVRTTTPAKLEEAFRTAGVKQGQMLEKSVRFYVKALQAAGEALPDHLTKARKQKTTPSVKRGDMKKPRTASGESKHITTGPNDPVRSARAELPQGFARQEIPTVDGAYIQYPVSLTDQDVRLFEAALAFIKAVAGKEGKQT